MLALVLAAGLSAPSEAATFNVDDTGDAGDANPGNGVCATGGGVCTLRAAVEEANLLPGADTIVVPAGTYNTGSELEVSQSASITGAGSSLTIVDANDNSRVFLFTGGASSMSGLTVRDGNAGSTAGGGISSEVSLILDDVTLDSNTTTGNGGGIFMDTTGTTLTMTNCTVSDNSSDRAAGINYKVQSGTVTLTDLTVTGNVAGDQGGGIRVFGTNTTAILTRVFIDDNDAGLGAGIHLRDLSDATLTDVTISNNDALTENGGGLRVDAGSATVTLDRVTVSGNTAGAGAGIQWRNVNTATVRNVTVSGNTAAGQGGGVWVDSGTVTHINTTIAGNSGTNGAGVRRSGGTVEFKNSIVADNTGDDDCSGSMDDLGNNLDTDGSCGFGTTADPLLGALQNNGGLTLTHALAVSSPAVDAGNNTGVPATDQRGFPRIFDGDGDMTATVDMGAYESQSTPHRISGTVFDDLVGNALAAGLESAGDGSNPGFNLATVRVFEDDGDDTPDAGDTEVTGSPVTTNGFGVYQSPDLGDGTYWVVVDSGTLRPTQDAGASLAQVWAEQTHGPVGAWCADGLGGTAERDALDGDGACYGGRRADGTASSSDDASTLAGSEHVARVVIAGGDVTADFGFSFNAVTTVRGGDGGDDDPPGTNGRWVQGSLRQFVQNANTIDGANAMRFVPAEPTNDGGGGGTWWRTDASITTVTVNSDTVFLEISGDDTTIDGRAYDLQDGVTPRETNPGTVGTVGAVGVGPDGLPETGDEAALSGVPAPELALVNDRAILAVERGLQIQADRVTVRNLAVHGFGDPTSTGADIFVGDNNAASTIVIDSPQILSNVLGADPSGSDPGANGSAGGCINAHRATPGLLQNNLVAFCGRGGGVLSSGTEAWIVELNEFRESDAGRLGYNAATGALDVIIRQNLFEANGNDGLWVQANDASVVDNTARGNADLGIVVFAGTGATASRNLAENNGGSGFGVLFGDDATLDFNTSRNNDGAGVLVRDASTGNLITRNSIYGNGAVSGQIGIDLLVDTDASGGTAPFSTPNDDDDLDDGGNDLLNFPVIDFAEIVGSDLRLTGFALPGSVMEFYIADADATYGEGKTYLVTETEGGGNDTDNGTGDYSDPILGSDTTNRFEFTIPLASLAAPLVAGDPITATATLGGQTSEFMPLVTSSISGTVHHDVDDDGVRDAGEQGIGLTWVKLVQGGSVQQVVQADPDTGAYSLLLVSSGTYDVIVDDNGNAADSTPTAPVDWAFRNPAAGTLAVTVAGSDVTDRDFGLTFGFDLAVDCVCGYDDGLYTQVGITIDGDMSDWSTVFADADNVACDATDDSDLDHPVQATGRNLVSAAATGGGTYFSMWTRRVGLSNSTQNFVYYADTDADGIQEDGEPVVVAGWDGSTGNVTLELYTYDDLGSGGDPLLDAGGLADGYPMPGDLTFVKTLTLPDGAGKGSTTGSGNGTQMEWTIEWAELGVPAASAIGWHVASTDAAPGAPGLGAQIDDNLGGCGGQCAGTSPITGITVTPIGGSGGLTVYAAHTFTNTGTDTDRFDLTWTSTGDFVPASVVFYRDLGTVGEFDPGVDTLLTDTDADTDPDTGNLAAAASFDLLIAIELPAGGATGDAMVTTVATSNLVPGCGGTVTPVSGSVDDPVRIVPQIVKLAFQIDGTPIASGETLPKDVPFKFLLYFDNPGAAVNDVSLQDVLDPAFDYRAGTIRLDNTLVSSVVCPAGVCDEAAIFAQVDGSGTALGDGDLVNAPTDTDEGSYDAGTRTLDVGDENNPGNAQLDVAADSVCAVVFTVRMQ